MLADSCPCTVLQKQRSHLHCDCYGLHKLGNLFRTCYFFLEITQWNWMTYIIDQSKSRIVIDNNEIKTLFARHLGGKNYALYRQDGKIQTPLTRAKYRFEHTRLDVTITIKACPFKGDVIRELLSSLNDLACIKNLKAGEVVEAIWNCAV